jgi:hypothetical protein
MAGGPDPLKDSAAAGGKFPKNLVDADSAAHAINECLKELERHRLRRLHAFVILKKLRVCYRVAEFGQQVNRFLRSNVIVVRPDEAGDGKKSVVIIVQKHTDKPHALARMLVNVRAIQVILPYLALNCRLTRHH